MPAKLIFYKMKRLIIIISLIHCFAFSLHAEDARFRIRWLEGATTMRPHEVADEKGNVTTVVFSENSDSTALEILKALLNQQGIWGTFSPEKDTRGLTWDQGIILIGSFVSEFKEPPGDPNGAAEKLYKEFKISGINVQFPFARWVASDKEDPVDTPYIVEFHLELRSLIPKGLTINGKPVDLKKYESKSENTQGSTDSPEKPSN